MNDFNSIGIMDRKRREGHLNKHFGKGIILWNEAVRY